MTPFRPQAPSRRHHANKPPLSARRSTLVCALLAAFQAASAQDSSSPQRVEVTGSAERSDAGLSTSALRLPVAIDKVPQSVVVLERRGLDEQGVQTLSEALRQVSNVRGLDDRDLSNSGLSIRGFDAGVVLDGVALPGYFSTPASLASAQRIEVIKGPAGTLYGGSQAAGNGGFVGGVVAITSATPLAYNHYAAAVRLGSLNEQGLTLDLNQALSDNLGLRLVADSLSKGSETDRITQKRSELAPSLSWRPQAGSELSLRYRQAKVSGLDYSGLPVLGTLVPTSYTVDRSTNLAAQGMPDTTTDTRSLNVQWMMSTRSMATTTIPTTV